MDETYSAWASRWRVPLGFALGVAYLIFSQPTFPLLLAGGTIAAWGVLLRTLAAGYLEKDQSLATGGPYAYTRNPLYLGSFFIGVGLALAGGRWFLGLAFPVFFLLVYWPVMRREEAFLRQQFGEAYRLYADRVAFFFPARRRAPPSGARFHWSRYRKNREYEAALGYLAGIIFLAMKIKLR